MGDGDKTPLRLQFNPKVRLEFHGATITSDAGLLPIRELVWERSSPVVVMFSLTWPGFRSNSLRVSWSMNSTWRRFPSLQLRSPSRPFPVKRPQSGRGPRRIRPKLSDQAAREVRRHTL